MMALNTSMYRKFITPPEKTGLPALKTSAELMDYAKLLAFHDANPKICMAVRASHEEANAFIKAHPHDAAKIYLKLTHDKKNSADDLVKMITDPDIDYTTAPAALMQHFEFMHKVGRLKHMPSS